MQSETCILDLSVEVTWPFLANFKPEQPIPQTANAALREMVLSVTQIARSILALAVLSMDGAETVMPIAVLAANLVVRSLLLLAIQPHPDLTDDAARKLEAQRVIPTVPMVDVALNTAIAARLPTTVALAARVDVQAPVVIPLSPRPLAAARRRPHKSQSLASQPTLPSEAEERTQQTAHAVPAMEAPYVEIGHKEAAALPTVYVKFIWKKQLDSLTVTSSAARLLLIAAMAVKVALAPATL